MTLYPGTGFGPEWNGRFFVCDFRGNPGYSGIHSFRNDPKLSGFSLADTKRFVWDVLPTDVEFGADGDLYWSDWVTTYDKTGKGRIYRVSPESRDAAEQAKVDEVQALLAEGFGDLELSRCVELLDHDDRRVREGAQRAFTTGLVRAGVQIDGRGDARAGGGPESVLPIAQSPRPRHRRGGEARRPLVRRRDELRLESRRSLSRARHPADLRREGGSRRRARVGHRRRRSAIGARGAAIHRAD